MMYHIIALFAGFILDLMFGDPYWLPHPVRLMGRLIGSLEKRLNTTPQEPKMVKTGKCMVGIVLLCTLITSSIVLLTGYLIHPVLGCILEAIMTYQVLATKCLKKESMKVYAALQKEDLLSARKAVSMIVGRDTMQLDELGVAKAAIETVAENTSDGVIAPLLYTAIGGPVFGMLYKAINTMDSMVGYKNDRYLYFGRMAAKLDDVVNFLPARISAVFMIIAAFLGGRQYSASRAWRVYLSDRFHHASPNSAQTEAACAGALGIMLAGDASYFGKTVKKPFIGKPYRQVEIQDIVRVNRLMYLTAFLCEILCLLVLGGVYIWSK